MRTVSFTINISIDGYSDHTSFKPDEELMDYFTHTMDEVDLIFYGRVMYQLMFPYWADVARDQSGTPAENRFARRLVAIDRVVMSRTLESADDKTTIIHNDPAGTLLQLKQQPGKTISVDTLSLLPELLAARLIDEFHFVIHPVIAGKGRPLLAIDSLTDHLDLKLVSTRSFKSGHIAIHYKA